MTLINLASLGITEEQLVEKIIDKTVERLLTSVGYDEEGDEFVEDSRLVKNLNDLVKKLIDAKVEQMADAHVKPLIESRLESLVLQQTNTWGEKTGQSVTFIEYLVKRADAYMSEPVDINGKTQDQDRYNWRQYSTRVAYMMGKHLDTHIQIAMQQALKDANSSITKGLEAAVKAALADVQAKLRVEVKV